ncbi:PPC domain-containing DNA-binding protein [Granulicella tundricola]|uniref:PPC domain-containing protein n=1 Tax=Granulicella tundricola (strain ATCC BAA-1859 / DSM 23138 / MP5ACTX9) TaxID=1198114 RepID=E8X1Y2_GRATM|nr:DUF296 domain-containing protein [Granulicella tundricola]ADW69143.1 protein of unknown function DUF296 [Granulicella tundricola MP5ACTX9]
MRKSWLWLGGGVLVMWLGWTVLMSLPQIVLGYLGMPWRVVSAASVDEVTISPSRAIPVGGAPGMQVTLVHENGGEKVYAVIFKKGDEVLSGLTDFAIQNHVGDAHFTGIGAVSGATTGWLDLSAKVYRGTVTKEQVEVLSLTGDIATFQGKPVVHGHVVLGRRDGSTVGGHLWEAKVNPTLEVFVTVDERALPKRLDDESGMKVIDAKP